MSQDLILLNDAATLVGKNLRTIQRYIKNGQLSRHQKDGTSFVSRQELENKFSIKDTPVPPPMPPIPIRKKTTETVLPAKTKVLDFQVKWVEEIEKHAQTREELGVWKGRAEAYQQFASRLLGNGKNTINIDNLKKDGASSPSLIKGSFIFYLATAILALVFILLLILIRIYTS